MKSKWCTMLLSIVRKLYIKCVIVYNCVYVPIFFLLRMLVSAYQNMASKSICYRCRIKSILNKKSLLSICNNFCSFFSEILEFKITPKLKNCCLFLSLPQVFFIFFWSSGPKTNMEIVKSLLFFWVDKIWNNTVKAKLMLFSFFFRFLEYAKVKIVIFFFFYFLFSWIFKNDH